ncbi:MAG: hypothetical protein IPM37_11200 [Hahellaceae bacterium]|nr:hypothetical protein [Hahellaceae bacterium]
MIIRHYLTCLLALLIAVQSVAAMADVHRFHQSGTEHLTFNHAHDLAAADSATEISMKATNVADPASTVSQDCHHCCHCHGMTHLYLGGNPDNLIPITLGKESSDYHFIYHSYAGSPDNPPPIG